MKTDYNLQKLKTISLILNVLLFLLFGLGIFCSIFKNTGEILMTKKELYTYTIGIFITMLIGYYSYVFQCKNGRTQIELKEKMNAFFIASLLKYTIFGLSSIITAIALMKTGDDNYLYIYVMILIFLLLHRPTKQRFIKDLSLSKEHSDIVLKN